ncbi:MAG: preprotein translocase subunit SecY [Flavobacteriaceae bacterium]|nr:preprotein translocase subunit SecY [Flavobacteriaceae bacterium]
MKNFINTLRNIWRIDELRQRILLTLTMLGVFRIGTFIVLPGIDPLALEASSQQSQDGLLGLINTFAGGAYLRGSIFALGIMPYISASIVIQLLTLAVPYFQRIQKEGEDGRRKMNQYTRYLTIAITVVQGIAYLSNLKVESREAIWGMTDAGMGAFWWTFTSTVLLTTGTMFVLWLGEKITDKGLGNGVSLIIMVGIIARLPLAILAEFDSRFNQSTGGMVVFLVEMVALMFVVMGVIMLVQGTRKIPVQYAKRIVGNRQFGGARQYLPLKLNAAGVMPIIFAQALMFIPSSISQLVQSEGFSKAMSSFLDYRSFGYNFVFAMLIILFTYFYTAISVNARTIADDLKKNNGFIPGVKPGNATSDFIDNVMSRITLPGAVFLAIVAILPSIASLFGVNSQFGQFYGGTSLLILVGVVLDTLQQIESYLLMRHYDGLMKSGRIKGRTQSAMQTA